MSPADSKPGFAPAQSCLSIVMLIAVMTLLLALVLVWDSEAGSRPGFAYSMFIATSMALAAGGTLLSRGEFVAARQWLHARVAPTAAIARTQKRHGHQLLSVWLACTAPLLLVSNTLVQGLGGPLALALLMAVIAAIAEWGQLQRPLLRRAWAAWTERWRFLDGKRRNPVAIVSFLPLLWLQTGSPDTAHAGLPQWGETLDWRYLLRLAVLTAIALSLLQSPDLHWRRLLAPGTRRAHIGWRILWASLKGNLAMAGFLAMFAGAVAASFGSAGIHWEQLPAVAATQLPDLLLATLLAVTLRGFAGSPEASVMYLLALSAEIAVILYVFNPSWQRDGWHGLALAALMLLLLLLVRRAWLHADLVRLAAAAQAPPEPTGWEQ